MKNHRLLPSRLLNDSRGILGLGLPDFFTALGIFMTVSPLLEETPYALCGIPTALVFLCGLIPLRLKTRRQMLRDTLAYFLTPRRVHDPRNGSS